MVSSLITVQHTESHDEIWIHINLTLISQAVNQCASFRSSNCNSPIVKTTMFLNAMMSLNMMMSLNALIYLNFRFIYRLLCANATKLQNDLQWKIDWDEIWHLSNLRWPEQIFGEVTDIFAASLKIVVFSNPLQLIDRFDLQISEYLSQFKNVANHFEYPVACSNKQTPQRKQYCWFCEY